MSEIIGRRNDTGWRLERDSDKLVLVGPCSQRQEYPLSYEAALMAGMEPTSEMKTTSPITTDRVEEKDLSETRETALCFSTDRVSKNIQESAAPPLCLTHDALNRQDKLEVRYGNECVACSLNERIELLTLLDSATPNAADIDSVTALRQLISSRALLDAALRGLMTAYERRIRSDCTPAQLQQAPWRVSEYCVAEEALTANPITKATSGLQTDDLYTKDRNNGWLPIEFCNPEIPVLLYTPPEKLWNDPKGRPIDVRYAKPRDWTWATHGMALVAPAATQDTESSEASHNRVDGVERGLQPFTERFALSGHCDNGAHQSCPYPERCICICHIPDPSADVSALAREVWDEAITMVKDYRSLTTTQFNWKYGVASLGMPVLVDALEAARDRSRPESSSTSIDVKCVRCGGDLTCLNCTFPDKNSGSEG